MVIKPRVTYLGLKATITALEAYISQLNPDDDERKYAINVMRELKYQWIKATNLYTTSNKQYSIQQGDRAQ